MTTLRQPAPLRIESEACKPMHVLTFATLHAAPWPEQPNPDASLLVTMTPDIRAFFIIERWDILTAREARHFYRGAEIVTGGVLLRVMNPTTTARAFVGNLHLVPNVDAIATRAAFVADRDWQIAYDRAIAALKSRTDSTEADRELIALAQATHVPPSSTKH